MRQVPGGTFTIFQERCEMKNEIRRGGQTLALSHYNSEVRAKSDRLIGGKIFTDALSADMGGWREMLGRGCFKKSLRERNIYMLWQHDHAAVLANTKNGTLRIWEEADGYAFEVELPDTQLGRDVYQLVKSETVGETSFAMSNIIDSFEVIDGEEVRIIREATLHEISPVTWAAYPSAYVTARNETKNQTQKFKDYFCARKESNQMTKRERQIQEKLDRANKFLMGDRDFKTLSEQLTALKTLSETGIRDDRLNRASGLPLDDYPVQGDFLTSQFSAGNITELWTRALTIPLQNSGRIYIPTWDEKTRTNGSLLGGMNYNWVEESGTVDLSSPKFRMLDMKLHKIMGLFPYSSELGEDATAFDQVMNVTSQKGLNYMIDDALIRGTGVGRPQGFLHSNCKIRISKEGGQSANSVLTENIFNMIARVVPECWTNGDLVFWGHPSVIPEVSALTTTVGTGGSVNPLWHWRQGGERHNKLCGLDFIISDRCSPLGTEGDIILADLRSVIITYKPAKKATSAHVGAHFLADEELFRLTMRMNIQNILSRPIAPAQGSDTLSTVITLETRG
jgi:HK97 family phage prohead protease/HK97 family phage major capsid protein